MESRTILKGSLPQAQQWAPYHQAISLTIVNLREKVKELQVELSWGFQNLNRAPGDLFTKWNNFPLRQKGFTPSSSM